MPKKLKPTKHIPAKQQSNLTDFSDSSPQPQPPEKAKTRRRVPCSSLAWACGVLPTALYLRPVFDLLAENISYTGFLRLVTRQFKTVRVLVVQPTRTEGCLALAQREVWHPLKTGLKLVKSALTNHLREIACSGFLSIGRFKLAVKYAWRLIR